MKFMEIISKVDDGAKFSVDLKKRTLRLNGKLVDMSETKQMATDGDVLGNLESLYCAYKHSVPSERSESHRRSYFKALPESGLSDGDMMYGQRRETARCYLELYVLVAILDGSLKWQEEWGSWFWQSSADKDLILLREWIEP